MNVRPLRLTPGGDLRQEIERAAAALPGQSAFVLSGIGSLRQANVRFAAAESPTVLVEPLEILSLAGSVTAQGAHLHASLSTAAGQVIGGHLGHGCIVRTTAEVLLAALPQWQLTRAHDSATGHAELAIVARQDSEADSHVTLKEITADTVRSVIALAVADDQKGFVAPNAVSLSQALFAPEAWYRAICLSGEPVGFVMLEDESLRTPPPPSPKVSVWRLMVDARFQRQGIGKAALLRVIEHARAKGLFESLELSYVPGPGCPEPFYLALGFRHTGRVDGKEIVLELPLPRTAA